MRSAIWEGRGTNEFIASPTENGGDERRRPGDTEENKLRKINMIVCALCDKKQEQPTRALAAGTWICSEEVRLYSPCLP